MGYSCTKYSPGRRLRMKGSEAKMLGFMEGADKRYVIPVYQRKYDWKIDNCRQPYEDLKKIVLHQRSSHFFGSIVSAVVPNCAAIVRPPDSRRGDWLLHEKHNEHK